MRLREFFMWSIGAAALAMTVAGCAPDPIEVACVDRCERNTAEGCGTGGDCMASCAPIGDQSSRLSFNAALAGCSVAYGSYESCIVGALEAPACTALDNPLCAFQEESVVACFDSYCAANPGACK